MSVVPIRPVFQDGQRLTAERLTQALEFLRTMLRRVLLAPLSSGVAGGFELTPTGTSSGSTLTIDPGLAIDGQGRLIVVPDTLTFSLTDIAAGASTPFEEGTIIRICLAQKESTERGACSPLQALGVEEGYEVIFEQQNLDAALFDIAGSYKEPNSVPAWGDLDPPYVTPQDSCVTLGHLVFADATTFTATPFFRDGVSPRFKVIRNTAGTPSILLNELNIPGGPLNPPGKFPTVAVPLTMLLGPNPIVVQPGSYMAVYPPAHFADARGTSVQATRVAPYGDPYSAGGMWSADQRVFVFPGGSGDYDDLTKTSEIPAGLGGIAAMPCEVDPSSGPIDRAGLGLAFGNINAGVNAVQVSLSTATDRTLAGISAGPEVTEGGRRVVPVATAGLVKVLVEHTGDVGLGTALCPSPTPGAFRVATSGEYSVCRTAQLILALPSPVEVLVWVQNPRAEA